MPCGGFGYPGDWRDLQHPKTGRPNRGKRAKVKAGRKAARRAR